MFKSSRAAWLRGKFREVNDWQNCSLKRSPSEKTQTGKIQWPKCKIVMTEKCRCQKYHGTRKKQACSKISDRRNKVEISNRCKKRIEKEIYGHTQFFKNHGVFSLPFVLLMGAIAITEESSYWPLFHHRALFCSTFALEQSFIDFFRDFFKIDFLMCWKNKIGCEIIEHKGRRSSKQSLMLLRGRSWVPASPLSNPVPRNLFI